MAQRDRQASGTTRERSTPEAGQELRQQPQDIGDIDEHADRAARGNESVPTDERRERGSGEGTV